MKKQVKKITLREAVLGDDVVDVAPVRLARKGDQRSLLEWLAVDE